jgi:hypothetical protein
MQKMPTVRSQPASQRLHVVSGFFGEFGAPDRIIDYRARERFWQTGQ